MATVTASDARKNFAEMLRQSQDEPVVIEKRGEPEGVLIAPALFEQLMRAAEELEDVSAFDDAMNESGENIPWDAVKVDLGWA